MKTVTPLSFFALIVFAMLLCVMAQGCGGPRVAPVIPSKPNAGPVIAAQIGKDATVLAEADAIDTVAPAAKPHTDAQRAAIAAAPAVDVRALSDSYEATIKGLQSANGALGKENLRLAAELASAKEWTDRVIRIGGYALSAILLALAAASIPLAAQVPWLGLRISIALAGSAVSIFTMLQAYEWTKAHPWITGIALLFLVAAGALAYANHIHAKSEAS